MHVPSELPYFCGPEDVKPSRDILLTAESSSTSDGWDGRIIISALRASSLMMTFRLVVTKKDLRQSDFVLAGEHPTATTTNAGLGLRAAAAVAVGMGVVRSAVVPMFTYTSETKRYTSPRNGARATTTITRTDHTGDRFQAGIIDWPVHRHDRARVVVGTRTVSMSKSGIYTSPEQFTAADGDVYEWQVEDARLQLVPLRTNRTTTSYVATFVQSESRFWLWRKLTSSLFIPPEGFEILDDIVVTFIYFASRWRDKEGVKSRSSISGSVM